MGDTEIHLEIVVFSIVMLVLGVSTPFSIPFFFDSADVYIEFLGSILSARTIVQYSGTYSFWRDLSLLGIHFPLNHEL